MAIINTGDDLGTALAKIHQAGTRPNFELNFNRIQNSMLRRLNDQIDEIANDPAPIRAQKELARKMGSVQEQLPLITAYTTGNEHNGAKLETLTSELSSLRALFSRDDDDTNLTAAEATDVNTARDEIVTRLKDLYIVSHPDVSDGNVIGRLRDGLSSFESLTATDGIIDAEGTDPTTNDNRAILDTVDQLISDVAVASEVTANTVSVSLNFKLTLLSKFAEYESKSTEITVVEAEKRNQEIENLKITNANLLKAISLSFEASNFLSEQVGAALQPPINQPGSILNIFT